MANSIHLSKTELCPLMEVIKPFQLSNGTWVNMAKLIQNLQQASKKIMEIYQRDFSVDYKDDLSPLTQADTAANEIICFFLKQEYPHLTIISEEIKNLPYQERSSQSLVWLVDPLDGTKEFVKRTGEFTINLGLVEDGKPILGLVNVPTQNITYFAAQGKGAYKMDHNLNKTVPIFVSSFNEASEGLKIAVSVSHPSQETQDYVKQFKSPILVSAGSSLKLLMVAEGIADIYPRFGPTSEWDTAAAHAILKEAGGQCVNAYTEDELCYNKENLLNPFFICFGKRSKRSLPS